MIKQRICIVGDGLSGLMTAAVLAKVPGTEVILIAKKATKTGKKYFKYLNINFYYIIKQT